MFVRHNYRFVLCCLLSLVALGGVAHATLIVDTGETANPVESGWTLHQWQWVAGAFTLDQAYTVTDVEAWMYESTSGDMTVAIYGDGGDRPDITTELFSTNFLADNPDPAEDEATLAYWAGPHGLNWNLGPGTYWAAFEIHSPSSASFAVPSPVPAPLDHYAFSFDGSGGFMWIPFALDFGLRVNAAPRGDVVPEPATLTLCALGLLGLARRGCRSRKRA